MGREINLSAFFARIKLLMPPRSHSSAITLEAQTGSRAFFAVILFVCKFDDGDKLVGRPCLVMVI